jgi:1-acyl-sn-glycerol-3-phosphate acyltransferase
VRKHRREGTTGLMRRKRALMARLPHRRYRATHLPLWVAGDPRLYAFARLLLGVLVRLYGRYQASGAARLPARGPAIVAANHPSDVDPILLAVALPRTLSFMADAVQFRRGFVGPVIERLGAFPVHVDKPDPGALLHALRLLRQGRVVAIFPEGDVVRRSEPGAFLPGVALLAAYSGAPVVPAAISGAERLWCGGRLHWTRIEVRFGPPVEFDGSQVHALDERTRMTDAVRAAVVRLLDHGTGDLPRAVPRRDGGGDPRRSGGCSDKA